MAKIPIPRSWNQLLGDMVDAFLSRFGLKSLKVGSPVLSILEAAGQSDLRSSQHTFDLLNAQSLDRATGIALDRIGADEDLVRLTESPASGTVTITDASFTKVSSKIYQGQPAPIVGSNRVYVTDASPFPATGSIYVGRGTGNYEGPLAYSSRVNNGTYWTLNLVDNTRRFHNLGESVVLAQGGNRIVPSGALAQTPQGNTQDAVKFATLFQAIIPDGETQITAVQVLAQKPGVGSNASAGAINAFVTPPFTGATVTNALPFTNGQAAEDDKTFRERIKAVRQSRAKGTALAIRTAVQGIVAPDENKRVSSSSVVTRLGYPTTLYIDDGTGYEEKSKGVAVEPLVDSAFGGEQYFQVAAARPVSKAFVVSTNRAPFQLLAASRLAVKVGGVIYEHAFETTDFRSILNATAYEISASINANPLLGFNAATADSGTRIRLFARADTLEDIEVVSPALSVDANEALLFPRGRVDTLRLYKNDRLLSKDGKIATVLSRPPAIWGALVAGETLELGIDGTAVVTYVFTNQDFIDADTGYTSVGRNSLSAWAKVFNAKVPGITARESNGLLELTSNADTSVRAKIRITGGTLVSPGQMFLTQTVQGADRDYTLDRNTGQIRLETPLLAGDNLSAGTLNTRAFLESDPLGQTTIVTGAKLWFSVDGDAQLVPTGLNSSTVLTQTVATGFDWGVRVRITADGNAFTNVQAGDWMIAWDANVIAAMQGVFRVAKATDTYVEIERSASPGGATFSLQANGMVFVRSTGSIQEVEIPASANYTARNFATIINSQLQGAGASTYRTNSLRINTGTYSIGGDIALVAQDIEAVRLGLSTSGAVENLSTHLAAIQSGNPQAGTPEFTVPLIAAVTSATELSLNIGSAVAKPHQLLVGLKALDENYDLVSPLYRHGHDVGSVFDLETVEGSEPSEVTTRQAGIDWLEGDAVYLASPLSIGPAEDLVVVADQDTASKRFTVPMHRKLTPVGSTYGIQNTFRDADNSDLSLAEAFGLSYSFNDFAVYMAARALTHEADATKRILWRYSRLGPDGDTARLSYVYPSAPNQDVTVSADSAGAYTNIRVGLPSGAQKTGYAVRATTRIGTAADDSGALPVLTYVLGYSVSSATRSALLFTNFMSVAFEVGELVTGLISGATATVVSIEDFGSDGENGDWQILKLTNVIGTFISGETIQGDIAAEGNFAEMTYQVALDLAMPSGGGTLASLTGHGFSSGQSLYLASTNVNFTSGPKTLVGLTATSVTYETNETTLVTATNIGTVSYDPSGEASFAGATPSPVAIGDLLRIESTAGLSPAFTNRTLRISYVGPQVIQGYVDSYSNGVSSTPNWAQLGSVAALKVYSLASSTATDVVTKVQALAAVEDSTCPVTAVITGTGAGIIDTASFEEAMSANAWAYFSDGVNYVRTTTAPLTTAGDYQLTFKSPVSTSLGTNTDWSNEDVRLVPVTTSKLVTWLKTVTVTGLSTICGVDAADRAQRVQISSLTPGSAGSIQVQGGSSNAASAAVIGAAALLADENGDFDYPVVTVKAADTQGLMAGAWVNVTNTTPLPKQAVDPLLSLLSWTADGVMTFDFMSGAGVLWDFSNFNSSLPLFNSVWQVEQQGRYTCFRFNPNDSAGPVIPPDLEGVLEGDYVRIVSPATPVPNVQAVSSVNQGMFKVVRVNIGLDGVSPDARAFWIENPNAIPETIEADVSFLYFDSIMPGDTLSISTTAWGVDNVGLWTVETVGQVGGVGEPFTPTDEGYFTIKVSTADRAPVPVTGPVNISTGNQYRLIQVIESAASKFVKRIQAISPNQTDGRYVDVKFDTPEGYERISTSAGSVLTALDKLAFSTDLAQGIDGYSHTTGLIAEANRVVYGDTRDPATYPGVAAAGANININGPLVKRITCALNLRIRSGVSTVDVADRVRSAVASVINQTGIGQPIAISDLINAASRVNGVVAVSVVDPEFSAGSDLIPVQPFEKPLVLSLEQDILVSFAGS